MNKLPDILEDLFDEVLKERDTNSESKDARSILIMLCDKRLGDPSPEVVSRLEKIESIKALHALIRDFNRYESWDEMFVGYLVYSVP